MKFAKEFTFFIVYNFIKTNCMKKLSFIACFIAFTSLNLLSQVNFGLKFGVHTFDVSNAKSILIPNSSQSIEFKDAKIGFQGGIYTKFKIGSLILEPRLMLHSTKVEYTFNGDNGGALSSIRKESFTNLDIPVLFGYQLSIFNLMAGPVAHLNLNTSSDLFDIDGYEERFDLATYGYRLGAGVDIGKINIGIEYEGNFSNFGEYINIGGSEFSFDDSQRRILLNIGFKLF